MRQLILPFEQSPAYSVKDFIVSGSNEDAYRWLMQWPNWSHFCLALYGEKGCGKTHLGRIWQAMTNASYLEATDFNNVILEKLFNAPPLFVLDEAHLIEKEEKLFHFYNHLMSKKGSLLILSQNAPAHWGARLADLKSRLNAVPAIKIHSPDESLLTQVIQKLFNDFQVRVDEAVVSFLLKHIERSFESACFWVSTLNNFAMTQKRNITVPVVREILFESGLVEINQ